MTDYRCDHGYYAMGRDCPTCQQERGEARARLEQAMALLREIRWDLGDVDGLPQDEYNCLLRRIDAFLAGQPAPSKVAVDDAMIVRAMKAWIIAEPSIHPSVRAVRTMLVAALEGMK